jgi:uncharacterized membrane protein YfcA
MRKYAIINIVAMIVLAIGVINAITIKEVWILSIAVILLVILTIYTITERKKDRQKQSRNQG